MLVSQASAELESDFTKLGSHTPLSSHTPICSRNCSLNSHGQERRASWRPLSSEDTGDPIEPEVLVPETPPEREASGRRHAEYYHRPGVILLHQYGSDRAPSVRDARSKLKEVRMSEDEYHEWAQQQGLEMDDEDYIIPPPGDCGLATTRSGRTRSLGSFRPSSFGSVSVIGRELQGPGHLSGPATPDYYDFGDASVSSFSGSLSDGIQYHYRHHSSNASSDLGAMSPSSAYEAPSFITKQRIFIQGALESHFLPRCKDIRATPDKNMNSPEIRPGCHVNFIGDTILPPELPIAKFGDPFIVVRIFGDLWATCAKLATPGLSYSATASTVTTSSLSRVPSPQLSLHTFDDTLLGLQLFDFPLCSLTLNHNFSAYCARRYEIETPGPIPSASVSSPSPSYCQLVKPPERSQSYLSTPIDPSNLPQWMLELLSPARRHIQENIPYLAPRNFHQHEVGQDYDHESKRNGASVYHLDDVDPLGLALPEEGPTESFHAARECHSPANENIPTRGSKSIRRAFRFSMHSNRQSRRNSAQIKEKEQEENGNEASSLSDAKKDKGYQRRRSNRSSMSARLKSWFVRGSRANTTSSDSSSS